MIATATKTLQARWSFNLVEVGTTKDEGRVVIEHRLIRDRGLERKYGKPYLLRADFNHAQEYYRDHD